MPLNQPTPWWQLPKMGGALPNLEKAAPAGQYYDPTNFSYKNQTQNPAALLAEKTKQQQMADQQFQMEQQKWQQQFDQSTQNFDLNKKAAQQQYDINQQNQLNKQLQQQKIDDILKGLTNATGQPSPSGGSSGAPIPQVGGPAAPSYQSLDASNAAQNAEFGKLKAKSGQLGQSALRSLRSELAGRGILGSGGEGRGLADIVAGATNPLADLNTAALRENVGIGQHNQDLANANNLATYTGSITQRGQDISRKNFEDEQARLAQNDKNNQLLAILNKMAGK